MRQRGPCATSVPSADPQNAASAGIPPVKAPPALVLLVHLLARQAAAEWFAAAWAETAPCPAAPVPVPTPQSLALADPASRAGAPRS